MTLLKRATIKSYDAGSHRAAVGIAGSLSVWLDNLAVSDSIPASALVAGRECAVLFHTDDNPDDAVVVSVHGGGPATPVTDFLGLSDTPGSYSGQALKQVRVSAGETALEFAAAGGGGSAIKDADADTKVDTEEGADEDTVRMDVAGTERFKLQNTGDHLTITGNTRITALASIGNMATDALTVLRTTDGASHGGGYAGSFTAGTSVTGAPDSRIGLGGNAFLGAGTTVKSLYGLSFLASPFLYGSTANTLTHVVGMNVDARAGIFGGSNLTITDAIGAWIEAGLGTANVVTNFYGLKITWLDAAGTNRYGVWVDDIGGGTLARLLQLENAMYVKGTGEWTPAANQTPVWIYEGATPTARQVKWKAGNTLGAGDRVMVLV